MKSSNRVIVNTFVQYVRTVLSVLITLYTSRIVLANLGVSDYGIYSLVAGVIAMLSFISNSLSATTQRYLSYYQGKNDKSMMVKIFNNSICTQLFISIIVILLLLCGTDYIFESLLNIAASRLEAAKIVYYLMLGMLFFNMQSVPYLATLVSHENILYSSIVQIVDALLKIPIALSLIYVSYDKLIWFSILMCLTVVLNYCCYRFYCKKKYEECESFSLRSFQVSLFKEMFSFMGWMVYGAGCIIGRTQGTAILLNRFYDTAINAAFGIAQQVSGQFSFLSVSLITAIRPPIVKAEGSGNRDKMFRLTEIACKFSFLLLSIVAIPSIIHMDTLLTLWLENVPTYSVLFCRFILMSALVDQLTIGLGYANSAIGNVRGYTIIVNTIKLFTLPLIYILLKVNCSLFIVMSAYFFIEAICMSSRLFIMNIISNISIRRFCVNVFVPVMIPFFVTCITCYIVSEYLNGWYIILNYIVSLMSVLLLILLFGLRDDERKYVLRIVCKLI